jgi:hypothetical protein
LLAERYLELNSSEGNSSGRSKSRAKSPSRKVEKSSHADSSKSQKDTKKSSTPAHSSKTKSTSHQRNDSSSAPTSMAKKSDACYRCGGLGHKIAQCPHPDTRGISAKAMRIDSDVSSEEDSDDESFHESPVEAFPLAGMDQIQTPQAITRPTRQLTTARTDWVRKREEGMIHPLQRIIQKGRNQMIPPQMTPEDPATRPTGVTRHSTLDWTRRSTKTKLSKVLWPPCSHERREIQRREHPRRMANFRVRLPTNP